MIMKWENYMAESPTADNVDSIVVISDLHVGAGALDDFDCAVENEFVSFMAHLAKQSKSTELVINGDFLEFVQAEPWEGKVLRARTEDALPLCFTEAQSCTKLAAIIHHHPLVFAALGKFLAANQAHRIVVCPGNHDADLFFEKVRIQLRSAIELAGKIAVGDRLRVHLQRVYRPPAAPSVWIEHGHQLDDCNNFFIGPEERWSDTRPPIIDSSVGEPRLIECMGTRFLLNFLNRLDHSYPFVDNVKPFSKFFKLFCYSALRPNYGPIMATVAAWDMLRYVANTLRKCPRDLLSTDEEEEQSIVGVVREALNRLSHTQQREFLTQLEQRGIPNHAPVDFLLDDPHWSEQVMDVLSANPELTEIIPEPNPAFLDLREGDGTLTLIPAFVADESAELTRAARHALTYSQASAVVMGHTHESRDHPDQLNYVNTGSWTRYLQMTNSDLKPRSWSLLARGAARLFPYQLLYAEIDTSEPRVVVLKKWASSI
jgi:UDP-2,3-diacylglucosamine pyrophosphatase LpxH